MPTYAWIALAVLVGGLVLGTAWVAFFGFRAWRRAWPTVRRLSATSEELSERAAALERRIAELERKTAELERDAQHLSASLARARVLVAALQEAKAAVDRVRLFVP